MVRLKQIFIYPVKGFDPCQLDTATITNGGSLMHDRMFAFKSDDDKYINGKKNEKIFRLRSSYDLNRMTMTLKHEGITPLTFSLTENTNQLEEFASDYFEKNVTFYRNDTSGFPDDTHASGPTVVTYESIAAAAEWFPGLSPLEMQRRFRVNLVFDGAVPFWEDQLLPVTEKGYPFFIGDVQLLGINTCARCIVPTKNPETGDIYNGFQKIFSEKRKETLPHWALRHHFDHFYRFTVNTLIPPEEAGKILATGDEVKIITDKSL